MYEIVKGFFSQDDGLDSSVAIPARFGLTDSSADRWNVVCKALEKLNRDAPEGVTYKLIIAGRHGQGFHNLAKLVHGAKPWDEYWSFLDSDGETVWGPDALLTKLGEDQARDVQAMWKQEIATGMPLSGKFYCSPMTRAIQTCQLTFADIVDFKERKPMILENCREVYGIHSCDKRRTLSYLRATFPEFTIEDGFTEEDELFDPNEREGKDHVEKRALTVLNYIFEQDAESIISITTHAGFINGLVRATGHAPVTMTTGGVLPMVVKRNGGPVSPRN